MVGYDNLIFGPGIPRAGGEDGILAGDGRLNVSTGDLEGKIRGRTEQKEETARF